MSSQNLTLHNLICFFTHCKHREDEGNCGFSGTLIISLEGDCQCMERRARTELCSGALTENIARKF